jgi:hypothetical protein
MSKVCVAVYVLIMAALFIVDGWMVTDRNSWRELAWAQGAQIRKDILTLDLCARAQKSRGQPVNWDE